MHRCTRSDPWQKLNKLQLLNNPSQAFINFGMAKSLLFACIGLLSLSSVHASYHRLLQTDPDGWVMGRATWFDSPQVGSCGYGKLDPYKFGQDAVAAMPDVSPLYPGSCGRCFELKCRGIQAISADGSVNLNRTDACYDQNKTIIIKIVDTCPCHGNEKWAMHFDYL